MKRGVKRCSQIIVILLIMLMPGTIVFAQTGGGPLLRVVHASPNTPNVDIYVDNTLLFSNLSYSRISGYRFVTSGNRTVKALPAGANSETAGVIKEAPFPFEDNRIYTLLLVGRQENIELWRLDDDLSPPEPNRARLRIVHASPDAPAVDVCINNECPVTNLSFKQDQSFNWDPGLYTVNVRRAGTPEVALSVPNFRVSPGQIYTVFAMGLLEGNPNLQFVVDNLQGGRPPILPPPTGAFLSPPILALVIIVLSITAILAIGGFGFIRRHLSKV